MKITQVAFKPSQKSIEDGVVALSPELFAATAARFSRNNEGLKSILSKVDPENEQKSIDNIMSLIDYGHASIGDLAPVAFALEGVSIFLAYWVFSLCPTASGQESSTRYIKMNVEGLLTPDECGINSDLKDVWLQTMNTAFDKYEKALVFWQQIADKDSSVLNLPQNLLESKEPKDIKKVERIKRNYAFDRARYFLPVAAKTNLILLQSGRAWAQLAKQLSSSCWVESQKMGSLISKELESVSPYCARHSKFDENYQNCWNYDFDSWKYELENFSFCDSECVEGYESLEILNPLQPSQSSCLGIRNFNNRYGPISKDLQRIMVRMMVGKISMAELRDWNRHRTGAKYAPLIPLGFYAAQDQLPQDSSFSWQKPDASWGRTVSKDARQLLAKGDFSFIYWTLLGTQFFLEHTTSLDKVAYMIMLRTGLGAHFRYAEHFAKLHRKLVSFIPALKTRIKVGTAEPE